MYTYIYITCQVYPGIPQWYATSKYKQWDGHGILDQILLHKAGVRVMQPQNFKTWYHVQHWPTNAEQLKFQAIRDSHISKRFNHISSSSILMTTIQIQDGIMFDWLINESILLEHLLFHKICIWCTYTVYLTLNFEILHTSLYRLNTSRI